MVIETLTGKVVRWIDVTYVALNIVDPKYIVVWLHLGHGAMREVLMNRLMIVQWILLS